LRIISLIPFRWSLGEGEARFGCGQSMSHKRTRPMPLGNSSASRSLILKPLEEATMELNLRKGLREFEAEI